MVDIFDLKGLLDRIFRSIGIEVSYDPADMSVFDPAGGGAISIDGKLKGVFGKISRKVLINWDVKAQDVYYGRLHLEDILSSPGKPIKYKPISEFPAIVRDVSLSVKKDVSYKSIKEICLKNGKDILRSVQFIEQYLGDKIQSGYKGLVFSCLYQSNSRTLREDEVNAIHESILQALVQDTGSIRR